MTTIDYITVNTTIPEFTRTEAVFEAVQEKINDGETIDIGMSPIGTITALVNVSFTLSNMDVAAAVEELCGMEPGQTDCTHWELRPARPWLPDTHTLTIEGTS